MDRLKTITSFVFSSYKRSAAALFLVAVFLSIPITLSIIGGQQDIRQRASEPCTLDSHGVPTCPGMDGSTAEGQAAINLKYQQQQVANREQELLDNQELMNAQTNGTAVPTDILNTVNSICSGKGLECFNSTACLQSADCRACAGSSECINAFISGHNTGSTTTTTSTTVCPQDALLCPDGSYVTRSGPGCEFQACPAGSSSASSTSSSCVQCVAAPAGCSYTGQTCASCGTLSCNGAPASGASSSTIISITIAIPGIGFSSSSAQLLNNLPHHPGKIVEIKIVDSANIQVASFSGTVSYDPQTGLYKGDINLGNLNSGSYIVKVRTNNTLWKNLPGIQNIVSGQTTSAIATTLIAGDTNGDNVIDLLDYNTIISCRRNTSCDKLEQSDLNDDGDINDSDKNILYHGFSRRQGD